METAEMELHQVQADFVDCNDTVSGFVGGRGTGKTTIGAYKLMTRAEPNLTYAVITPTYPMMRDASLKAFLDMGQKYRYIREYHKSDMVADLGNGAHVMFRSADNPDRLRGPNLSGVWLDEASQMKREAFDIVLACLREGGKMGWLMATFTPNGRSHWTYDKFVKDKEAKLFQASTRDNPFLPPEFYDKVKHQYTGLRADQELEGKFVDIEGAEWGAELFPDSIWFDEWPTGVRLKVCGLDPSKGVGSKYGDYSAFVWIVYAEDGKMYVDADMRNDRNTDVICDVAIDLQRRWQFGAFGIETNGFQQMIAGNIGDKSRRLGVPFPTVELEHYGLQKEIRIRQLTPLLTTDMLRFKGGSLGAEMLVNQMRDFPLGDHDDGPDALHMAVDTMGQMMGAKMDGLGGNLVDAMGGVM